MFIKLTKTHSYLSYVDNTIKQIEPETIWVNVSQIQFFGNGYVYLKDDSVQVKETPEEILKRIQEVQNETNANK